MRRRQRLTNIGVGVLVGVSFTLTMTGRISYGAHWFVLSMVYLLGFVRLAILNKQLFRDLD